MIVMIEVIVCSYIIMQLFVRKASQSGSYACGTEFYARTL